MDIDISCLHFIAENIDSNIRELEGALKQIKTFVRFNYNNNKEIDLDVVKEALRNIISTDKKKPVTLDLILNVVADHYNIEPEMIKGSKKNNEIVIPRQIYMYLANRLTSSTQDAIGAAIGGKDHATIGYGINKIATRIKTDKEMEEAINILIKKINP